LYLSREYLYIWWPECAIGAGFANWAASFGLRAANQGSFDSSDAGLTPG
jgi:hypothetical protein